MIKKSVYMISRYCRKIRVKVHLFALLYVLSAEAYASPTWRFDGNQRSDYALYDDRSGVWYILKDDGSKPLAWALRWGYHSAVALSGDYDGNGIDDLAVYDSARGAWYIRSLSGKVLAWNINWGYSGTIPYSGDLNGDGKDELVVYDPKSHRWYARSLDGRVHLWNFRFGYFGVIPKIADFDADLRDDICVYDPINYRWYVGDTQGKIIVWNLKFGFSGVMPVVGDLDGNGEADMVIFDPSNFEWSARDRSNRVLLDYEEHYASIYVTNNVMPLARDFNGDGRDDLALYITDRYNKYFSVYGWSFYARRWGFDHALIPDESNYKEFGSVKVFVPGNVRDIRTGVYLRRGESFAISATGFTDTYYGGYRSGPDGIYRIDWPEFGWLLPNPVHGLIGKLSGGDYFYIGSKYSGKASRSGELILTINDRREWFHDNIGGYHVRVIKGN